MRHSCRSVQHGFSLAELMIAMVLGLLVVLAAGAMLVGSNRSFSSQADAAAIDDAGRFAMELIARAARQSAFVNLDRDDAGEPARDRPAQVAGLDAQSLLRDGEALADLRPAVANGSDVLALRFTGSGPAPTGDGSVLSCAGFSLHGRDEGWSIFYVANNADGEPELRCKYRGAGGWTSDALAAGVDAFHVLYGVDTDTPADGLANHYVNASAVNAFDGALALEGDTDAARQFDLQRRTFWKRVTSIKVALLLHGPSAIHDDRSPAVYQLFGEGHASSGIDRGTTIDEERMKTDLRQRERRLFYSTILLRNPAG